MRLCWPVIVSLAWVASSIESGTLPDSTEDCLRLRGCWYRKGRFAASGEIAMDPGAVALLLAEKWMLSADRSLKKMSPQIASSWFTLKEG